MNVSVLVSRLLQQMGDTPDAVAAKLRASNVQGVRNAARYLNPIVRYVQSCLQNEALDVDVIKGDWLCLHYPGIRTQEVFLPEPIQQFMLRFDQGKYPDLEMRCQES